MTKVKKKLNLKNCDHLTSVEETHIHDGKGKQNCVSKSKLNVKVKKGVGRPRKKKRNVTQTKKAIYKLPGYSEIVSGESEPYVNRPEPPLETPAALSSAATEKDNFHNNLPSDSISPSLDAPSQPLCSERASGQSSPTIDDICQFQYPLAKRRKKAVSPSPSPPPLPPSNHSTSSEEPDQPKNSSKRIRGQRPAKSGAGKKRGRKPGSKLSTGGAAAAAANNPGLVSLASPSSPAAVADDDSDSEPEETPPPARTPGTINFKIHRRSAAKRVARSAASSSLGGLRENDSAPSAAEHRDPSPPVRVTTPKQPKPAYQSSQIIDSSGIALSQSAKPGEAGGTYTCDMCSYRTSERDLLSAHVCEHSSDSSDDSLDRVVTLPTFGRSRIDPGGGAYSDLSSEPDDDEELPEAFAYDCNNSDRVKKGDILWVKTKKYPFWPAVVKNTYMVRKKLSKVTVVFIGVIQTKIIGFNGKPKGLTMVYNKSKIIPFGENHDMHAKLKADGLGSELAKFFEDCIMRVEDFVYKKATGETTLSTLEYFKEEMALDELEEVEMTPNLLESIYAPIQEASDTENKAYKTPTKGKKKVYESPKMSKALAKKQAKSVETGKKLIDMISTPKTKELMFKIHRGQKDSIKHRKYMDKNLPGPERNLLKYAGFGLVTDDTQRDEVMEILVRYWLEMQSKPNKADADIDYIISVWVPEAIIYAMARTMKCGLRRAERRFVQGPRFTKEEHKRIEREIMANKDSIDPEARELYDRKINRNVQRFRASFQEHNDSHL